MLTERYQNFFGKAQTSRHTSWETADWREAVNMRLTERQNYWQNDHLPHCPPPPPPGAQNWGHKSTSRHQEWWANHLSEKRSEINASIPCTTRTPRFWRIREINYSKTRTIYFPSPQDLLTHFSSAGLIEMSSVSGWCMLPVCAYVLRFVQHV